MSYRAKQATVALNLLALAMVGLLYRMDSRNDHIEDGKLPKFKKNCQILSNLHFCHLILRLRPFPFSRTLSDYSPRITLCASTTSV